MNEELELALAYWRTMAPQPKAIVYAKAIEARLKGKETSVIIVDHELDNAISRDASLARARGMKVDTGKPEEPTQAGTMGGDAMKGRRGRKPKGDPA
jgi:hypothetical protein